MKLLMIALTTSVLFGTAIAASAQKYTMAQTFTGFIMDSGCVSHEKLATKAAINEAERCTEEAPKATSTYVLYDPGTQTTYDLASQKDQEKAAAFAGQDVTLVGYVDMESRDIHVSQITPVS